MTEMGRGKGRTMAISPTKASRCWKKGDFGAGWAGSVVEREAMTTVLVISTGSGPESVICGDASTLLAKLAQNKCAVFTVHVG